MSVDVTVVVPVYNPGHYIDACIDSLLSQTLAVERREYLFVDDGSTDDTPGRLDEFAAAHADIRVIHQENSGWPGKPRNVGMDNAQGDYVFFADHDDRLDPEALDRMVAMARRTDADILIPKMVANGRPVPQRLFHRNLDRAVLGSDPLMESLTPHKLFRRDFLTAIELRFPEGKRRLEDHVFIVEAFLRADVISVLSDYPCYHRVHRDDDGNASVQGLDPDFYFQFVAETLDVIDRLTEPGELRSKILVRPYSGELVGKLAEKRIRRWEDEQRERIYDKVRPLMIDRFPPDVVDRLVIARRAHAHAILDDDRARLLEIADRTTSPIARAEVGELVWTGERWDADVEVELTYDDGSPIVVHAEGDRFHLDERLIPSRWADDSYSREDILTGYADVILRDDDAVEWYLATDLPAVLEPIDPANPSDLRVVFRGPLSVDPTTAAGGRPLTPGDYDLRVRMESLGMARQQRLRAGDDVPDPVAARFGDEGLIVTPGIAGAKRGLAVTVTGLPKSEIRLIAQRLGNFTIADDRRVSAELKISTVGAPLPATVSLVLLDLTDAPIATTTGSIADGLLTTAPLPPQRSDEPVRIALHDPNRNRAFIVARLMTRDGVARVDPTDFRAIRLADSAERP